MSTDIFIVTYAPDAEWLEYCLRSVDKYARNFRETVVVCPEEDAVRIRSVCSGHPKTRVVLFDQQGDGHLWQNIIKTEADLYSTADFIFHLDSDSVFTEPFSPLDAATDGKPDIFYGRYGDFGSVPKHVPWQQITSFALGRPVEVETMRRFPILYPRWLYKATREWIEQEHGKSFRDFVFSAPRLGHAYHAYCEFCTLGAVAYYRFKDQFHWRYFGRDEDARPWKIKQFGSGQIRVDRKKFEAVTRPELEAITAGYAQKPAKETDEHMRSRFGI